MTETQATFRMLDLFSGIGGFALAATWVWGDDLEIVSFVEKEPYCQKVLAKNFKGVPIHDDIRTFDGTKCGTVDLITGGFPCQPFSVAGKRKGAEDDRNLWPEMFRVIQETKPTWVIGENVANIINFLEFDNILADLESEGYEVQPLIIPAVAVDAPHRRDRVWIVANNTDLSIRNKRSIKKIFREEQSPESTGICNDVADAENIGRERHRETRERRTGFKDGSTTLADTDIERLERRETNREYTGKWTAWPGGKPFPGIWQSEPDVGRVVNGLPNRIHRIKALGNAIVPQVVYRIMLGIRAIEE